MLARGGEVGDRLVRQHLHRAPRLGGRGILAFLARAQAGHLVVERCIHVEQGAGDVEQRALAGRLFAARDGVQRLALLQHDVAGHAQAEHAQGIGDIGQFGGLGLQRGGVAAGAQVQVQRVLDPQQFLLDHPADGVEQVAVAAGQAAARMVELGLARRVHLEVECIAQRVQRRMRRPCLGDEVQQLAGRFLAGHALRVRGRGLVLVRLAHGAGDAGERTAQGVAGRQGAVAQRGGGRRQHPQHAAGGFVAGVLEQVGRGRGQRRRVGRRGLFRPCRQRLVEARLRRSHPVLALGPRQRRGLRHLVRQRAAEVRREQHALAQDRRAARGADVVEQRQQHDRDVAVAVLQSLEVVGQQHGAAHQGRAGLVAIAGRPLLHRLGEQLHLLGDHRRGVQLDHAQGSLHLVQVTGAEAHAAGIRRILGERLDLVARLAQGLVKLRLDPSQHRVAHRVAQGAHRRLPARRGRPALPGAGGRLLLTILIDSFPRRTLRPAT